MQFFVFFFAQTSFFVFLVSHSPLRLLRPLLRRNPAQVEKSNKIAFWHEIWKNFISSWKIEENRIFSGNIKKITNRIKKLLKFPFRVESFKNQKVAFRAEKSEKSYFELLTWRKLHFEYENWKKLTFWALVDNLRKFHFEF